MSEPTFAVVGHPNKGKSSIVATLAQDDSVRIAPEPGTTTRCRAYPMRVDDRVLYTLVDTPGFQRARRALAWMREHETSAAKHPEVVRAFVEAHQHTNDFPDECELLTPILEGAGILYVVDGSKPYGEEYEAEMEILRWTGQPSMALINPIGPADHLAEWTAALGQYFRVVRVFNAMTAEFAKRLDLLRGFGQLQEAWRSPLDEAVARLEADHQRRRQRAARAIADMLTEMLTLSVSKLLAIDTDRRSHEAALIERYKDKLRQAEQRGRQHVEKIYDHHNVQRREGDFELLDTDLFSQEMWYLFGLSRWKLAGTGAAGGAVVGGSIDAALGGASFLLGTAIGAVAGGATAWASAHRLTEIKVLDLPLGGKRLRCGPTKNPNLPYVLLGRARYHHKLIAGRTHAQRGELTVDAEPASAPGTLPGAVPGALPGAGAVPGAEAVTPLSEEQRRALEAQFARLRKRGADAETVARVAEELTRIIEPMLTRDEEREPV